MAGLGLLWKIGDPESGRLRWPKPDTRRQIKSRLQQITWHQPPATYREPRSTNHELGVSHGTHAYPPASGRSASGIPAGANDDRGSGAASGRVACSVVSRSKRSFGNFSGYGHPDRFADQHDAGIVAGGTNQMGFVAGVAKTASGCCAVASRGLVDTLFSVNCFFLCVLRSCCDRVEPGVIE